MYESIMQKTKNKKKVENKIEAETSGHTAVPDYQISNLIHIAIHKNNTLNQEKSTCYLTTIKLCSLVYLHS